MPSIRYLLLLFLLLPVVPVHAQDSDTVRGLAAHAARLVAQARLVDRLVRASGIPARSGPEMARSLEAFVLAEHRFRAGRSLPASYFDAAYFHGQHALLDAYGEQLSQVERLYANLSARRVP